MVHPQLRLRPVEVVQRNLTLEVGQALYQVVVGILCVECHVIPCKTMETGHGLGHMHQAFTQYSTHAMTSMLCPGTQTGEAMQWGWHRGEKDAQKLTAIVRPASSGVCCT